MSIEQLSAFLGWCLLINALVLTVMTLAAMFFGEWISRLHAKLFGLSETSVKSEYFNFLANYKLLVTVFNLTPFIALKIMQASS